MDPAPDPDDIQEESDIYDDYYDRYGGWSSIDWADNGELDPRLTGTLEEDEEAPRREPILSCGAMLFLLIASPTLFLIGVLWIDTNMRAGRPIIGIFGFGDCLILALICFPRLVFGLGYKDTSPQDQYDDSSSSSSYYDVWGWERPAERRRREKEEEEKLEKFINEHGREPGFWENW